METFTGVFIFSFPAKKIKNKTGNLIYRIAIGVLLQFIWLEIFYNEESSILCTVQPSGVIFTSALERKLRKLIVH